MFAYLQLLITKQNICFFVRLNRLQVWYLSIFYQQQKQKELQLLIVIFIVKVSKNIDLEPL